MQLIQRTPWGLVSSLRHDVDRLLQTDGGVRRRFVPAVDIHEEATHFVVTADLPGVDAAEIEITVEGELLTIRGERKAEPTAEDAAVQRIERATGPFERAFRLPETASAEGVEAKYRHGVLTVSIPKAKAALPYRIEVTAN
jgi:HSP20 family protein